jgi:hypothetical protein
MRHNPRVAMHIDARLNRLGNPPKIVRASSRSLSVKLGQRPTEAECADQDRKLAGIFTEIAERKKNGAVANAALYLNMVLALASATRNSPVTSAAISPFGPEGPITKD